jgi:hypothetical protein
MHVEIVLAQIIGTLLKKIGDKMTIEERYDRIDSAPYVIFQDDKTVHTVESIEIVEDIIIVETNTGWLFNDMDLFTLDEMVDIEEKIKELLK